MARLEVRELTSQRSHPPTIKYLGRIFEQERTSESESYLATVVISARNAAIAIIADELLILLFRHRQ